METVTSSGGPAKVTLPTDEQILITREFAAPPKLVYKAWTTPELVRRWSAGRRGEMQAVDIDLRVGGTWRYAMRPEGADEFAFYGEFLEIVPNEKIVQTETFAPFPDDAATNTMTLTERDGVTTLRTVAKEINSSMSRTTMLIPPTMARRFATLD